MAELLGMLFVVAIPLLMVALVGAEIAFRRSDVGQAYRRLVDAGRRIDDEIEAAESTLQSDRRRLRDLAKSYESGYIHRVLRRRPIRDLHPYLSVSMSWSALEEAGITDLAKFMSFRGDFERLHGIGEARGRGLRKARRQLQDEMAETSLPVPTLRPPGTLEFDVISAGLRVAELQDRALPRMRRLGEQLEEVRADWPGTIAARWSYWFGDRDELNRRLERGLEAIEPLVASGAPELRRQVDEAGICSEDVTRLNDQYGEHEETVKQLIDTVTRRPVRGALRPVGAEAMRAAEGFDDEEDFCDRGLEPLIAKLGYKHRREHTINQRIGSSEKTMYVDFLLLDDQRRPVAVLEAKRSIRTDNQLEGASQQGLSYALFEQLDPVMVAAPEGLWLYRRHDQQLELKADYEIEEAYERVDELRERIERLAEGDTSRRRVPAR